MNRTENSARCICYVGVSAVLTSLQTEAGEDSLFEIVGVAVVVDLAQLP